MEYCGNRMAGIGIDTLLGLSGAIFAGLGLIFNGLSLRQNSRSKYLDVLSQLHKEVSNLDNNKKDPISDEWLRNYLNLHDRIAYLAINKIIPESIATFFNPTFSASLTYLQHYKTISNYLPSLTEWCNKQNIRPLNNMTL